MREKETCKDIRFVGCHSGKLEVDVKTGRKELCESAEYWIPPADAFPAPKLETVDSMKRETDLNASSFLRKPALRIGFIACLISLTTGVSFDRVVCAHGENASSVSSTVPIKILAATFGEGKSRADYTKQLQEIVLDPQRVTTITSAGLDLQNGREVTRSELQVSYEVGRKRGFVLFKHGDRVNLHDAIRTHAGVDTFQTLPAKPAIPSEASQSGTVPLYRFLNTVSNQHSYTHTPRELAAWRTEGTVEEHKPIGLVATRQVAGTVRLKRASRETTQRHFYYTQASALHRNVSEDNDGFSVYVWTSPGDGRIPIYASTASDGTDVFLDSDWDAVAAFNDKAEAADAKPRLCNVRQPMFYAYPMESAKSKAGLNLADMRVSGLRPPSAKSVAPDPVEPTSPANTPRPSTGPAESLADVIERCERSVVKIEVRAAEGRGLGSGFVIARGIIATNVHVLEGAQTATAKFPNGDSFEIREILALDPSRDIAIARLTGAGVESLPELPLASELPRKGEAVCALGSPLGLSFTATSGVVSAIREAQELRSELGREDCNGTWVQVDAAISPGNSGGPIISKQGEVVAMSTLASVGAQNLNFGISVVDISAMLRSADTQAPVALATAMAGVDSASSPSKGWDGSTGIPSEEVVKYVERTIDDFPYLRRSLRAEVGDLRDTLGDMRNGESSIPAKIQRSNPDVLVVHVTDKSQRGRDTWYFASDRVKDEILAELTARLRTLTEISQSSVDVENADHVKTLLLQHGPEVDTRKKGSVGFMRDCYVIHAMNDHEVIVSYRETPHVLFVESATGLYPGSEIEPRPVMVAGTATVNIPRVGSTAITVLQAVPESVIDNSLVKMFPKSGNSDSNSPSRNWTDVTGKFSVVAKLIKVEGAEVHLERADGSVIQVPINKLSADDQQYLKNR